MEDLILGLNTLWVLVSAILVFFMQAGFGLLEAGFTRAKNAINILMKNLMDLSFGVLMYFAVGYAIMFGEGTPFFGMEGFGLSNVPEVTNGVSTYVFFFFQAAFAAAAATIVAGAVAGRAKFWTYILISLAITSVIYPVVGHWGWGPGGWLSEAGFTDFAGSTIVHSVGGWLALVGAIMIGPRIGRFDKKNTRVFAGHNIPLAMLGVLILWFGWYGFNAGSQLAIDGQNALDVGLVALNTTLAAAAGGVTVLLLSWMLTNKASPGMTINGVLAGLVSITAGCAALGPQAAILTGMIGGITMYTASGLLEYWKIDDAVGAFPVHGAAGVIGTLCVGIFATDGGWMFTRSPELFLIQLKGVVAVALWAIGTGIVTFGILKLLIGIRVDLQQEHQGLDEAKHGISAYPHFPSFSEK